MLNGESGLSIHVIIVNGKPVFLSGTDVFLMTLADRTNVAWYVAAVLFFWAIAHVAERAGKTALANGLYTWLIWWQGAALVGGFFLSVACAFHAYASLLMALVYPLLAAVFFIAGEKPETKPAPTDTDSPAA